MKAMTRGNAFGRDLALCSIDFACNNAHLHPSCLAQDGKERDVRGIDTSRSFIVRGEIHSIPPSGQSRPGQSGRSEPPPPLSPGRAARAAASEARGQWTLFLQHVCSASLHNPYPGIVREKGVGMEEEGWGGWGGGGEGGVYTM